MNTKGIVNFMKYLPVLIILLIAIVIFRYMFKIRNAKYTIENFEEEDNMSLVNEIRSLIMNNETEYQNNMNQVLEKLSLLEFKLVANKSEVPPVEPPVTTQPIEPPVTTQPIAPTLPPPPPTSTPPSISTPTTPPEQPPQMFDDEDSDDESNVSTGGGDQNTTETFIDGVSCSSTANCASLF
jgi:hypothetical protein